MKWIIQQILKLIARGEGPKDPRERETYGFRTVVDGTRLTLVTCERCGHQWAPDEAQQHADWCAS